MELIGSVFSGGGKVGDFTWMIDQADYADALFIFNDNEEEFRAHQGHPAGGGRCHAGGGNAHIRPYQCRTPQQAAGIPTGAHGQGYGGLTPEVRDIIDQALAAVQALAETGRYQRIIYSAAKGSPDDLGTGIFAVDPDVRRYIVQGLRRVAA